MSNTVRRLWIAVIVLAGTAIGSGAFAASQGSARNFLTQDAGTGTAAQSAESSKMTSEGKSKKKSDTNTARKKTQDGGSEMTSEDAGTGTVKRAAQKNTRTLTGCLQKGDDANEFTFTAQDGGTWEIQSDRVKLDKHVGHTVKIVGVVSNATAYGRKENAKESMKDAGMDKHGEDHGHITATDVTLVSGTCQK